MATSTTPVPRLTVLAVCGLLSLSGCAAIENKSASSSVTPDTASSVASPRTSASVAVPNPPPVSSAIPPTGAVSLALAKRGDLGEIVVDGTEHTVYVFSGDRPNQPPTCYDQCAATWPPVLDDDHPASGIGIDVAAAKTVTRRDGTTQVTYMGMPLYHYAGDESDKDANGQAFSMFGGVWHVLTRDGRPLG